MHSYVLHTDISGTSVTSEGGVTIKKGKLYKTDDDDGILCGLQDDLDDLWGNTLVLSGGKGSKRSLAASEADAEEQTEDSFGCTRGN